MAMLPSPQSLSRLLRTFLEDRDVYLDEMWDPGLGIEEARGHFSGLEGLPGGDAVVRCFTGWASGGGASWREAVSVEVGRKIGQTRTLRDEISLQERAAERFKLRSPHRREAMGSLEIHPAEHFSMMRELFCSWGQGVGETEMIPVFHDGGGSLVAVGAKSGRVWILPIGVSLEGGDPDPGFSLDCTLDQWLPFWFACGLQNPWGERNNPLAGGKLRPFGDPRFVDDFAVQRVLDGG